MDSELKRRFLTTEQVAEELNVGLPLIRNLLQTGELRGMQVGVRGLWRIARNDIEAYISRAYQTTAAKIEAGGIPDENQEC